MVVKKKISTHAAYWARVDAMIQRKLDGPTRGTPAPNPYKERAEAIENLKRMKHTPLDKPATVKKIRAEIAKRDEALRAAREEISRPTHKLTQKQRAHLHSLGFTAEQVRAEITAKPRKKVAK